MCIHVGVLDSIFYPDELIASGLRADWDTVPVGASSPLPRKLPTAYLRKLNEEQKTVHSNEAKRAEKKEQLQAPDSGRLKSYVMVCQACGTRAKFTVDEKGYATCSNCRAIASFRFGHLA